MSWCVLGKAGEDQCSIRTIDTGGRVLDTRTFGREELPSIVERTEAEHRPRWVWSDTSRWYPELLAHGVRVERCHDLRLAHAILRRSARVTARTALEAATSWDADSEALRSAGLHAPAPALFDLEGDPERLGTAPTHDAEAHAEFVRQREALRSATGRPGLELLIAAESAGALIAEELRSAGLPWDARAHDRLLSDALGPRPATGEKPVRLRELAEVIGRDLGGEPFNIDSPPQLLRALQRAGFEVASTSKWVLAEHASVPVIARILEYKQRARLLAANGWAWLDEWVRDRRYRPVYLAGGVVTGRWAAAGGGALQLPTQLRSAMRADPGWALVSADVAQLEPRILAAMSGDRAMADAARGRDLYEGVVRAGTIATRESAKLALLGALYGATTGESGRLVPRLRRAYPRAMRLVDDAAAVGESGGRVATWLGRTSLEPPERWFEVQRRATDVDATAADERAARGAAREQGRFTRNFVVQGTAAEWALAWIADLRLRLSGCEPCAPEDQATASGPAFRQRPHLAFFLHDEVIVHTPENQVHEVREALTASAQRAGELLFGETRVDFPLDISVMNTCSASPGRV